MLKILHNPRCGKSRAGLAILEESGKEFEVVKYLDDAPTKDDLVKIIRLLGCKPLEIIRTNEAIWKENFKGKTLTDDALINAMVQYPKLIERPIVYNKTGAVVGRPPENILVFLKG